MTNALRYGLWTRSGDALIEPTGDEGMSGEIRFTPDRIRKHADELTRDFVPKIEKARTTLNTDAVIEGGDFSMTGTPAAVAYPGALQFAFEDLATHERMLGEFAGNVESSARLYQSAEERSTIRRV